MYTLELTQPKERAEGNVRSRVPLSRDYSDLIAHYNRKWLTLATTQERRTTFSEISLLLISRCLYKICGDTHVELLLVL